MKKLLLPTAAFLLFTMTASAQPVITQQPTNQVVTLGGTMALTVTADDPLAAYQWLKDGRLMLGATNNMLTVTNAGAINTGAYLVVVTNGNGVVISQPALVAVGNPALLAWGNNQSGQLGDGTTANEALPEIIVSNAVTAAAGAGYTLFVTADGTLWAMGNNQFGQLGDGTKTMRTNPVPVIGGTNVVAVAAGSYQSLFVKSDGTLWAMGVGFSPTPINVASGVVAAAASLFVKSDGTLWKASSNPTQISGASNVVAVAVGSEHTLVLRIGGTLWATGNNTYGEMVSGSNVVAVAAGYGDSLFLKADGTLWGVGFNTYGELGDGSHTSTSTPITVASNVVAVAAGIYHSLFATSDGTLWAVGYNSFGQLGDGNTTSQPAPVPVATGVLSLAGVYSGSSANHSLAIGQPSVQPSATTQASMPVTATNATLNGMAFPNGLPTTVWFEWGQRGSFTQTTSPVNVGSGNSVVRVNALISGLSSSNVYQCSLVASNSAGVATGAVQWFRVDYAPKVAAWGDNASGQSQVPQNLTNVVAVGAGGYHSLALQADGTVRNWGQDSSIPASATNVVALGTDHLDLNLALRSDGTFVSWGNNSSVPAGLKNVVEVAAGDGHGLALVADGRLAGWLIPNFPNYGQATVPLGMTNVVAIGCGADHNLVLKADGTVVAWGYNDDGETNVPPNATNVIAIAPGSFHNLVLRADGSVVAWGDNTYGQSDVPPGLSNVVAIAGGGFHSMALKCDGTVVAWGGVGWDYGQASVPLALSNVVAIAAGGFHSLVLGGNVPPVVNSQTSSGFVNQDVVITPTLSDANNDTLNCRVASLPILGALYQYAGGIRGPQITTQDTPITDASSRVIFAPAPNNDGAPYATFGMVANDGQADSAPGTMTVNIFRAAQNFTAQNLGTGVQVKLTGTANYPYILQMATNLTPPVVWHSILTNPADGNGNWNMTITNSPTYPAGYYRAVVQ